MHVITHYLREHGPTGSWADRANQLVERLGSRDLPLRHYSEARLRSAEARCGWVEPDVRGLPE
jgi:hypothetical protein